MNIIHVLIDETFPSEEYSEKILLFKLTNKFVIIFSKRKNCSDFSSDGNIIELS